MLTRYDRRRDPEVLHIKQQARQEAKKVLYKMLKTHNLVVPFAPRRVHIHHYISPKILSNLFSITVSNDTGPYPYVVPANHRCGDLFGRYLMYSRLLRRLSNVLRASDSQVKVLTVRIRDVTHANHLITCPNAYCKTRVRLRDMLEPLRRLSGFKEVNFQGIIEEVGEWTKRYMLMPKPKYEPWKRDRKEEDASSDSSTEVVRTPPQYRSFDGQELQD